MTTVERICAAAFGGIAATVLAAASAVAWATANGAPEALRMPFRLICHGIESRAFVVFGAPMPICARCSGFYLGMLVGVGIGVAFFRRRRARLPVAVPLLAAFPLAIDGTGQFLGLWATGNWPRAATGLIAGAGLLVWALAELRGLSAPDPRDATATVVDTR